VIDVSADLPDHFEASLEMLGFSRLAGDMMPLDRPNPSATPQAKERRVAAAAKTRRRERRGERRARGSAPAPKPKPKRK
jgi:23S rRNA pseudouridine955/2504/2580 synthase